MSQKFRQKNVGYHLLKFDFALSLPRLAITEAVC